MNKLFLYFISYSGKKIRKDLMMVPTCFLYSRFPHRDILSDFLSLVPLVVCRGGVGVVIIAAIIQSITIIMMLIPICCVMEVPTQQILFNPHFHSFS